MKTDCIDHGQKGSGMGYGVGRFKGVTIKMHRKAYIVANNLTIADIEGMHVRHKCDNPRCINPEHLELGTRQDNMDDMKRRGRSPNTKGERNTKAKLTWDIVKAIRESSASLSVLANKYGVGRTTISDIKRGVTWISS